MEPHKQPEIKTNQIPNQASNEHKGHNTNAKEGKIPNQDPSKIINPPNEENVTENPNQTNEESNQTTAISNPEKEQNAATKIPTQNIINDSNQIPPQNTEEDELSSILRKEMLSDLKYTILDNQICSDFLFNIDKIPYSKYSLCSPIAKNDPHRQEAYQLFTSCYNSDSENLVISRSFASFYGMMCGDSIGSFFEFQDVCLEQKHPIKDINDIDDNKKGGNFRLYPGQWTDDSSMGLCLADSLIFSKGEFVPKDIMQRFLAWCYCGMNNTFKKQNLDRAIFNKENGKSIYHDLHSSIGLGGNISLSFKFFLHRQTDYTKAGDVNTSGNGSLMRLAPIPIYYHSDVFKAAELSGLQSLITHQGTEAFECCKLMGYIIASAINYPTPIKTNKEKNNFLDETIKKYLPYIKNESVKCLALSKAEKKNFVSDDPDRNWNWKSKVYCFSNKRMYKNPGYYGSYAMDGMSMALHCVWNTDNAKDAILKAANMRGDADTVASIAGQMTGAIYGLRSLPKHWIRKVNKWDDGDGIVRVYRLICKKFMDFDGNEV